ncbi:MAG: transthyretin-like family protein [Pseudomonadales bacterium]|nr:transthyretin-like family protein [Pseudomonadales bacterium]
MKLRQLTLALSLVGASSIGLVGCGGGSNNYEEIGEVTLSGTAVKGVLSSATVVACLASSSDCSAGSDDVLATTQTGSDGSYRLSLGEITDDSSVAGQPVLVKIFADTDTSHNCDFSACEVSGQNDVTGLELSTLAFVDVPDGDASVSANISALTEIATQSFLETFEVSAVQNSSAFESAQQSASNAVASLLGLDLSVDTSVGTSVVNLFDVQIPQAVPAELGDVTSQDVGDVTIPVSLIQELSVINASFGATVDADTSISDAISEVANLVSTVVGDTADGEDVDSGVITTLTTIVTAVNTEVTTISTDVSAEVDGFEEPQIVDASDVEDNVDNLEVDTDLDDGGDGGTQPSGGSGGSGGSGVQ